MTSEPFPHRIELAGDRFAYVIPLTYGRARINVARNDDPMGVVEFY